MYDLEKRILKAAFSLAYLGYAYSQMEINRQDKEQSTGWLCQYNNAADFYVGVTSEIKDSTMEDFFNNYMQDVIVPCMPDEVLRRPYAFKNLPHPQQ